MKIKGTGKLRGTEGRLNGAVPRGRPRGEGEGQGQGQEGVRGPERTSQLPARLAVAHEGGKAYALR
jgi:hypothetical protein